MTNRKPLVIEASGIPGQLLAGDALVDSGGNPFTTPPLMSAAIDTAFGSVQGDILYRDAAVWKVLAPGAAGQVLSTGGAGANPSWVTGGGGGGGQHEYEAFGALPLAATFSTYNFQAGTVLTDSATSLMLNLPGQGAFNFQIAYKAAPATPYDLYFRVKTVWSAGGSRGGCGLFNSTTKRCLSVQWQGTSLVGIADDTGPATFNSNANLVNNNISWGRIHTDGTTITLYVSADGKNWMKLPTTFVHSTYAPDSIAVCGWCQNSASSPSAVWVGSFGTSAPA